MKKYKRTLPMISPAKIAIVALCAAIATVVVYLLAGSENEWIIICGGLFIALMAADLFVIIPSGFRYSYDDFFIKLSYLSIVYRKISYSKYAAIFISNASYNNGYGSGVYGNIPIQYKSKGKTETITTIYPFITLHSSDYPVKKTESGMSSRDLIMLDSQDAFCLGICWFDSLTELLDRTDISVYVLEDVYLRFRKTFDSIFIQHEVNINRLFIVTDHAIEYKQYL